MWRDLGGGIALFCLFAGWGLTSAGIMFIFSSCHAMTACTIVSVLPTPTFGSCTVYYAYTVDDAMYDGHMTYDQCPMAYFISNDTASKVCYNAWRRGTSTLKLDEYISPTVAVATLSAGTTFFAIVIAFYVYVKNKHTNMNRGGDQLEFKSINNACMHV